jgi:hypothetical protein
MVKNSASFVLASLRPRWTAFLTILRTFSISSSTHISLYCQGPQKRFYNGLL